MSNMKRLAYRLPNINEIADSELKAHEILLDYENNDLVVIDKDGNEAYRLSDLIRRATENCLDETHLKSSNQHIEATETQNGFMSKKDKQILNKLVQIVKQLSNDVQKSVKPVSEGYVFENPLNYSIIDKKLYVDGTLKTSIINKEFVTGEVQIKARPNKTFINAYSEAGYRDDFVGFSVESEEIVLKYFENVKYTKDDRLFIGNVEVPFMTTKMVYMIKNMLIVPVCIIRRRNNEIISVDNMSGKITDSYVNHEEILDIAKYVTPDKSLEKLLEENIKEYVHQAYINNRNKKIKALKTNIKGVPFDNELVLSYIPLNGDDRDVVTGQALGGKIYYKKSPFGKMMGGATSANNLISFKETSEFVLSFIAGNCSCKEAPIQILDSSGQPILTVNWNDKVLNISGKEIELKNPYSKYKAIDIKKYYGYIDLFIDGELVLNRVNYSKLNPAFFININPDDICEVCQIIITSDMKHVSTAINEDVVIFDNVIKLSDNPIIVPRVDKIDLKNLSMNNISVTMNNSKPDRFMPGDYMTIAFENDLVDLEYINSGMVTSSKTQIENVITVKGGTPFRKNDIVKVFDGYKNIENTYMVNEAICVNGIQSVKLNTIAGICDGMYIAKSDTAIPIYLEIDRLPADVNFMRYKKLIKIVFNKEYLIRSNFVVHYIEKKCNDHVDTLSQKIKSVSFGDINVIHNNDRNFIDLSCKNMDIYFNDKKILPNEKDRPMLFIDDDITVKIKANVKDFLPKNVDLPLISSLFEPILHLKLNTGSNHATVNGNVCDTNNITVDRYIKGEIDDNGDVLFVFKTKSDVKQGKLYLSIDNIKLCDKNNMFFINDISFIKNQFGIITDLLIGTHDMLYICSQEEVTLFYTKSDIEEVTDIVDTEPISCTFDNYTLVKDICTDNIFLQDIEKVYRLDRTYVRRYI